jgi:hypothetical protein
VTPKKVPKHSDTTPRLSPITQLVVKLGAKWEISIGNLKELAAIGSFSFPSSASQH